MLKVKRIATVESYLFNRSRVDVMMVIEGTHALMIGYYHEYGEISIIGKMIFATAEKACQQIQQAVKETIARGEAVGPIGWYVSEYDDSVVSGMSVYKDAPCELVWEHGDISIEAESAVVTYFDWLREANNKGVDLPEGFGEISMKELQLRINLAVSQKALADFLSRKS